MAKAGGTVQRVPKRDLEKMTAEELDALRIKLSNEADALREYRLAVTEVHDRKATEEAARLRLEALSDAERAALLQELKADGAASSGRSGQPGKE